MTRIDMSPASSSDGPCLHVERCPTWRTRDERTLYVCRMSDRHLHNAVNTALRTAHEIPPVLDSELARRKVLQAPPKAVYDVVYGYKVLIADGAGQMFSPREATDSYTHLDWFDSIKERQCYNSHAFMDEAHFRLHRTATGCGLYFFRDQGQAEMHANDYRYFDFGSTVVVQCVLFGTVASVEFGGFHGMPCYGYLAEKARVEQVWAPIGVRYSLRARARRLNSRIVVNNLAGGINASQED